MTPFPDDKARRAFFAGKGPPRAGSLPAGRLPDLSHTLRGRLSRDVHPHDLGDVVAATTAFLEQHSVKELRRDQLPLADLQAALKTESRGATKAMLLACRAVLAAQQLDARQVLTRVRLKLLESGYPDNLQRLAAVQTLRHVSAELELGNTLDNAFESLNLTFPPHYTAEQEQKARGGERLVFDAVMDAYWGDL